MIMSDEFKELENQYKQINNNLKKDFEEILRTIDFKNLNFAEERYLRDFWYRLFMTEYCYVHDESIAEVLKTEHAELIARAYFMPDQPSSHAEGRLSYPYVFRMCDRDPEKEKKYWERRQGDYIGQKSLLRESKVYY